MSVKQRMLSLLDQQIRELDEFINGSDNDNVHSNEYQKYVLSGLSMNDLQTVRNFVESFVEDVNTAPEQMEA